MGIKGKQIEDNSVDPKKIKPFPPAKVDAKGKFQSVIDWSRSISFYTSITGNSTFVFSAVSSKEINVAVTNSGNYSVTWPSYIKWPNGSAPVQSTGLGATDVYSFVRGGPSIYGAVSASYNAPVVVPPPPVVGSAAILAHYKMNDNTSSSVVIDVSGHNGTLINGLTNVTSENSVAGKINNCLSFDRVDDAVTADLGLLDLQSDISVALWVFQATATIGAVGTAIGLGAEGNGLLLYTNIDPGTAGASINPASAGDAQVFSQTAGINMSFPMSQNAWNHIVIMWSPSVGTLSVFKNKVLQISQPIDDFPVMTQGLLSLACQNGNSNLFAGKLDDVRIYNATLTQAQINALYNSGNGIETELV